MHFSQNINFWLLTYFEIQKDFIYVYLHIKSL